MTRVVFVLGDAASQRACYRDLPILRDERFTKKYHRARNLSNWLVGCDKDLMKGR